jgi:hypothetical protein
MAHQQFQVVERLCSLPVPYQKLLLSRLKTMGARMMRTCFVRSSRTLSFRLMLTAYGCTSNAPSVQ